MTPASLPADEPPGSQRLRQIGLLLGPVLAILVLLLPAPAGLSPDAWRVVALAALMGTWWVTEAIPLAATSFLPIVVLPLAGISSIAEATAPFAEPIIFLILGGMIIALGIERWGLHKRIALGVLSVVGSSPRRLVLGFMIATGFLSMWISNSAATMMMLPIAASVGLVLGQARVTVALLLGVAYAASIGGMATLIGTPPNAMAAGYIAQSFGTPVSFTDWFRIGLPVAVLLIPLSWLYITRISHPIDGRPTAAGAVIAQERAQLGRWRPSEVRVALLCSLAALAWTFRTLLQDVPGLKGLSDAGIAILFAILMFVVPSGDRDAPGEPLLRWSETTRLNWGVIMLFGGGLSLAAAIDKTGLAQWLGASLQGLSDWHPFLLALLVAAAVCFLSEIASNTALVAALLPVLGATAKATGIDPMLLIVPATLAASCGFMLPAATGPNAIAYGTGRLPARDMLKAGIGLDIIGIVVIASVVTLLVA